jgi:hypothetical protein
MEFIGEIPKNRGPLFSEIHDVKLQNGSAFIHSNEGLS